MTWSLDFFTLDGRHLPCPRFLDRLSLVDLDCLVCYGGFYFTTRAEKKSSCERTSLWRERVQQFQRLLRFPLLIQWAFQSVQLLTDKRLVTKRKGYPDFKNNMADQCMKPNVASQNGFAAEFSLKGLKSLSRPKIWKFQEKRTPKNGNFREISTTV